MSNHITETTGAIVGALKADGAVTALTTAARVYNSEPPATPVWPFVLVGSPIETPDRYSCWDGSQQSVVVHGFAKGPGEVATANLANAIKRALDGKSLVRGDLSIEVTHEQTQIIRDSAEASAYHALVRFRCYAVEYAG